MLPMILLLISCIAFGMKVYVVEREHGSLTVLTESGLKRIEGLGNLNHATLKFLEDRAYLISRDGYISLIDTRKDRLIRKVKVGESTIGFTFCMDRVAVANYSPHTVVILNKELETVKEFRTSSRNVGIKSYKNKLIFSLMDKDSLWVIECDKLEREKILTHIGEMPFDALMAQGKYIVGLFKENAVGVYDIEKDTYTKVVFRQKGKEVIFKVPHFGLWGVYGDTAYIPAVGERKIHVVSLRNFSYKGYIELIGLPVFVAVSPDGKYIAVNFSGDKEDFLTLINRESLKPIKSVPLGRRVLHFRFTPDGRYIYLSSYYENKLKKVSVPDLEPVEEVPVLTPSGVFIKGG